MIFPEVGSSYIEDLLKGITKKKSKSKTKRKTGKTGNVKRKSGQAKKGSEFQKQMKASGKIKGRAGLHAEKRADKKGRIVTRYIKNQKKKPSIRTRTQGTGASYLQANHLQNLAIAHKDAIKNAAVSRRLLDQSLSSYGALDSDSPTYLTDKKKIDASVFRHANNYRDDSKAVFDRAKTLVTGVMAGRQISDKAKARINTMLADMRHKTNEAQRKSGKLKTQGLSDDALAQHINTLDLHNAKNARRLSELLVRIKSKPKKPASLRKSFEMEIDDLGHVTINML